MDFGQDSEVEWSQDPSSPQDDYTRPPKLEVHFPHLWNEDQFARRLNGTKVNKILFRVQVYIHLAESELKPDYSQFSLKHMKKV